MSATRTARHPNFGVVKNASAAIWHCEAIIVALSSLRVTKTLKKEDKMLRSKLGIGMLLNTEAHRKGHQAARSARPLCDNPFTEGTSQWADWQSGWRVATRIAEIQSTREKSLRVPASSAFDMGQKAALSGLSATANPYLADSPAHREWRRGWSQAKSR